jgi:glycosyltransferase involved in cell wall biosynthesis
MKLLMICDYPMNASEIDGGVAAATFNLVQSLLKYTDIEITVIGFTYGSEDSQPVISNQGRLRAIRRTCPRRFVNVLGLRQLRPPFRDVLLAEKPDIVHAQGEGIYASLAVTSGLPNVYTIHGVRLKELLMSKSELGFLRHYFRQRLIKQHHKKAKNIVAINEYTKAAIAGLHNAEVWLINNAIDEHFFELYSLDDPIPGNILLVGGVRPRKDIITCLSAVRYLRDYNVSIHLDIVGPDTEGYLQEVSAYIAAHQLGEHVTLHGLVTEDELDALYICADILVLSSIEESSPIAIVQGMAAGKPIVSTNVGGISEMVEESTNCFLVDAGDWQALGDRLRTLIENRDLRSQFGTASYELALRAWSAKAVALKTDEMYKEIVNGR